MDLRQVQALLVNETRTRMAYLAVVAPIATKAENLRDISRLFQAVGICRLIVDANSDKFCENLIRSGQARRYYLRKSREEGDMEVRFLGLSRTEAIFDAIVSGAEGLARDIASLSVEQWHPDWEYEDDFCYFLFVQRLVTQSDFVGSSEAQALLERFGQVLEGKESSRLLLCKAMHIQDKSVFSATFERFIAEYKAKMDTERAKITEYSAQAIFWPKSFVSIEALAWLNLAHKAGWPMEDQFALCPPEARDLSAPYQVCDFFESLDQALAEA